MEKSTPSKIVKSSNTRVKQPNEFTMARYDLTRPEKNIMYFAVKYLQEKMGAAPDIMDKIQKMGIEELLELDRTLFGDFVFSIPISYIKDVNGETGNETNATKIWYAAKKLRARSFEIMTEDTWMEVGFFNWIKYRRKTGMLELEISHQLIPYILKAINNYTLFNFITAISFKKYYSQRFYEIAHRWRDTGYWRTTPEDLRHMLKMEPGKYENWADFKNYVLKPAEEELKEKGDIWFSYKETKHGRKVVLIEFSIYQKEMKIDPDKRERIQKSADYLYTSALLVRWLDDKQFFNRALSELANDESKLQRFAERLKRIDDDIVSGAISKKPGGLIRTILKEDYGIN